MRLHMLTDVKMFGVSFAYLYVCEAFSNCIRFEIAFVYDPAQSIRCHDLQFCKLGPKFTNVLVPIFLSLLCVWYNDASYWENRSVSAIALFSSVKDKCVGRNNFLFKTPTFFFLFMFSAR